MAETEIISNSDNNEQFFEGVEKLIEIWFTPVQHADLRKITRYLLKFTLIILSFEKCQELTCKRIKVTGLLN